MAPATTEGTAAELIPARPSLPRLREAAAGCRACPLWKLGTQTVFGEGTRTAELMVVGEQPGDQEDRAGRPFVGPAGKLLRRSMQEAGLDPGRTYVTNVVKHFKWRPAGKRRLHQTPRANEIEACKPWLESELAVVKPTGLIALGATAAKALLGPKVRVTKDRGELLDSDLAPLTMVTVHPSSILRLQEDEERRAARAGLVSDLEAMARALGAH